MREGGLRGVVRGGGVVRGRGDWKYGRSGGWHRGASQIPRSGGRLDCELEGDRVGGQLLRAAMQRPRVSASDDFHGF